MNKFTLAAFFTLLTSFLSAGYAAAGESAEEQIVATVNGTAITQRQVDAEYYRLLPRSTFHRSVDENKQKSLRMEAFNSLIEKELKIQDARKLGLKVKKKEIDQELERLVSKYPSEKEFKERLEKSGLKIDDIINEIERRKLAETAYQKQVVEQVHVTEAEAQTYYHSNKETFILPPQYHLKNILLKVPPLADNFEKKTIENQANSVVFRIKEGMPFDEAVEKYSEGSDKEKGGDMGFIHKGRLEPEMEKEIYALQAGDVAGPFQALKGHYIFRVEAIRPERSVPFEEIKASLMKDLTRQAADERSKVWIEELNRQAVIVIKDSSYLPEMSEEMKHSEP